MAYNKYLKKINRWKRLLFPSAAETEFMRVMGWWWRLRYRPRREYELSGYCIDFALIKQQIAIEIDGSFHKDVIGQWNWDRKRDQVLYAKGWLTLRIPARDVFYRPNRVRYTIKYFMIHAKYPSNYPKNVKNS